MRVNINNLTTNLFTSLFPSPRPRYVAHSQAVAVYNVCIAKLPPKTPESLSDTGSSFLRQCFIFDPENRPFAHQLRTHNFCDLDEKNLNLLKTTRAKYSKKGFNNSEDADDSADEFGASIDNDRDDDFQLTSLSDSIDRSPQRTFRDDFTEFPTIPTLASVSDSIF